MCRYGAERAATEAASVDVNRVLNHLPRRDVALIAIAGVRSALIGQVKRLVELLGGEGLVWRCDDDIAIAHRLDERGVALHHIAKRLYLSEVLSKLCLILDALLERVEHLSTAIIESLDIGLIGDEAHLTQASQQLHIEAVTHSLSHLANRLVAHTVDKQVGTRSCQHRALQRIGPIVVVRKAAQRRLNATHNHRGMRKEVFENLGIGIDRSVGAEASLATRRIGVVGAEAYVGRIVVDHRVHSARSNGKEEAWLAEFLEVTQVIAPIWLRHDGNTVALRLEDAAYDRRTKGGVVDVGIARKDDDIELVPATSLDLFHCCWQKHIVAILFVEQVKSHPYRDPRHRYTSPTSGVLP